MVGPVGDIRLAIVQRDAYWPLELAIAGAVRAPHLPGVAIKCRLH